MDLGFFYPQFFPFGAQAQVSESTPISNALVSELASSFGKTVGITSTVMSGKETLPESATITVTHGNLSMASWDSSSSEAENKSSRGSTMQRKDSFYETDEESHTPRHTSPLKQKKLAEEPPPSYESAVEVSREVTNIMHPPPLPPHPQTRHPQDIGGQMHDGAYENVVSGFHQELMMVVKNKGMAPLPSYEEAILGSGEVDVTEAPPIPPRGESKGKSGTETLTVAGDAREDSADLDQVQEVCGIDCRFIGIEFL